MTMERSLDDGDEADIARRLVASEQSALADAFHRWGGMIHALCTRWAGHDAADDLTQQVFVAAWQGRATYDPTRGALGAWLVGIARNTTNRSFRGVSEIPTDPTSVVVETPDQDDASTTIANELLLATALASLPEAQRQTLQLSYWDGLTQAEVAARLELPLGTVKSHQRRGLQRLRNVMEVSDEPR